MKHYILIAIVIFVLVAFSKKAFAGTNQSNIGMYGTKPIRNKNPFAIIQKTPDNWKGLKGIDSDGFLIFDTDRNGARAGFINLWNGYLQRGINTIPKILEKYAPYGHGGNDPKLYANHIYSITGYNENTVIDYLKLYNLGRAITKVERGEELNKTDLLNGFIDFSKKIGIDPKAVTAIF